MAWQVSGEPPKSTRVFGVHRSSSSILTEVSTSPRTKPNLHNRPSTNNHQYANKIFQKIACEIFHDLPVSPGFRRVVGFNWRGRFSVRLFYPSAMRPLNLILTLVALSPTATSMASEAGHTGPPVTPD